VRSAPARFLAGKLGRKLYRIDLSAVSNKYIGETEKNLRRLFDDAEASNAILFFDEADALFGKRSEVQDGHDRYANLETSYLLQRLENYSGLVIFATNNKGDLDSAFIRRLRFVVEFPLPSADRRRQMWPHRLGGSRK
jgi:SpoVK/Ycf46/Vps4 family AAA+-type ATPase